MSHYNPFSSIAQGEINNCAPSETASESKNPCPSESTTQPLVDSRVVEPELGLHESPSCPFDPDKQHLLDLAEHNVNGCLVGKRSQISLPENRITAIARLMVDVDVSEWLGMLTEEELTCPAQIDPVRFWQYHLAPILDRHPLFRFSEVRFSGRGFHVLVCLDEPVLLPDDAARDLWKARLQVLQCMIPSDPQSPGLNIMTRALNSINGKNGKRVVQVRKPTPVSATQVIEAVDEFRASPFKVAAQTLFGSQLSSCPLCHTPGSSLRIGTHNGVCYGGKCGSKLMTSDLFDRIFIGPWKPAKTGGDQ